MRAPSGEPLSGPSDFKLGFAQPIDFCRAASREAGQRLLRVNRRGSMGNFCAIGLGGVEKIAYHWELPSGHGLCDDSASLFRNSLFMVTIRLSRGGAKKQPFYHVVATDSRARRDGRYIERLGYYNPVARGASTEVKIDIERVDYWIGVGAQMSDSVKKIVKDYRKSAAAAA